ncbi:MAG: nucleotide exchange factor GrpE [Gemmataceae bacterium]
MSDALSPATPDGNAEAAADRNVPVSSLYRLCEEMIQLRELTRRQYKLFEQTLTRTRDSLQQNFNTFAADSQRAYQQLRDDVQGDKRCALGLLQQILEIGLDLDKIVDSTPREDDLEAFRRWSEGVAVEARKVRAMLERLGLQPYDAVIGSAYDPALHERVGSKHVEGMGPYRIAEQQQPGFASQQPHFVLCRPKVIVSE